MPLAPENSLALEQIRKPTWYGLDAQTVNGHVEFLVNAGGPNEGITLAEELFLEIEITGPYNLLIPNSYQRVRLIWLCGSARQVIPVNDLKLTFQTLGDEPFIDFTAELRART